MSLKKADRQEISIDRDAEENFVLDDYNSDNDSISQGLKFPIDREGLSIKSVQLMEK